MNSRMVNIRYYGYERLRTVNNDLIRYIIYIGAGFIYFVPLIEGDTLAYFVPLSLGVIIAYKLYLLLESRIYKGKVTAYYPLNLTCKGFVIRLFTIIKYVAYSYIPMDVIYSLLLLKNRNASYARQEIDTFVSMLIISFIACSIVAYLYYKYIFFTERKITAKEYTDRYVEYKKAFPISTFKDYDNYIRKHLDTLNIFENRGVSLINDIVLGHNLNKNTIDGSQIIETKEQNKGEINTTNEFIKTVEINPKLQRRKR